MRGHRMPALRTIALVMMAVWGTASHAAGLGPVRLQSALGQSLRASVPVLGTDVSELTASCIRVRLEQPDGSPMMAVHAAIARNGDNATIQLSTRQAVNEPAVMLNLQVACGAAIQRSYQLLLDPVISLPHLAQSEPPANTGTEKSRGRLRDQAMVAAPEDGVALAPSRRMVSRQDSRSEAPAPIAQRESLPPQANKSSPKPEARKVTRSVLKLSSDDEAIDTMPAFPPGLKLSDSLSESRDTGDAQSAAELKKAYDRFAAVLRDEDPAQSSEKQLKEMQLKLQELEKQTALLKEQSEKQRLADQAALESAKRESFSSGWIIALGGLLLAALVAVSWLYRRIKELGREHSTALWEKTVLGQPTEAGEWENTLGVNDTFAQIDASTGILTEAKPSDWERGVPLDDTLAVDWASQQATMQTSSLHAASARHPGSDSDADAALAAKLMQHGDDIAKHPATKDSRTSPTSMADAPIVARAMAAADEANNKSAGSGRDRASRAASVRADTGSHSMEVEEISDLMQEAEFWMLLNDPERAIEMLQPCLEVSKPVSPVPWIYLLDLYRVTEQQKNYESLAARLKQVFNTNAPAWGEQDSAVSTRSLRDYPHVVKAIEDLWEGDEIIPYLESLLLDEREGERAGFDLAVYREIIHLIGVARDPKTTRTRAQLSFDEPQPRLISQKVSKPAEKASQATAPLISEEEAAVFDRATSKQAITRQVTAKAVAPKAAAAEPALPKLSLMEDTVQPGKPQAFMESVTPMNAAVPAPASPNAGISTVAFSSGSDITDEAIADEVNVAEEIAQEEIAGQESALEMPALPESLIPDAVAVAPAVPASSAVPVSSAALTAEQDVERVADMARKLDLVLAYQEIGEHVGARVLLEEVIQGGTPLQAEKAKAMLKKLLKEIDWQ